MKLPLMKFRRYIAATAIIMVSTFTLVVQAGGTIEKPKQFMSEGRINGLIAGTGNRAIVETTLAKIKGFKGDGEGVWSYEWRLIGEYFEALADKQTAQGNKDSALKNYISALRIYKMGYMPGNYTPSELRSYAGFRNVGLKINQFLEYPFTVVKIPFEGKEIITHLYLPEQKAKGKPPLVLYTGGTDGSKEESHSTTQTLASKGIAVVTFDLAGSGESMQWDARPDSDKLHKRILDYFEEQNKYDFNRVGLIGASFGGYYAVKMAAEDDRIKAAINHCGLVDSAFRIPMKHLAALLKTPDGAMTYSAIRRMGFDPEIVLDGTATKKELVKLEETAISFSLISQGIVGTGKKTINIPLLIVNGSRDSVVSAEDIKLLEDASTQSETWIMGLAAHCAPNYMGVATADMMTWLVEKLEN